ncbi:nucleoside hydrolase [Arthrobacter sp. C152]
MPTPTSSGSFSSGYSRADAMRYRVIIDNDYAGDPDGFFQLVHHLLCESVDIKGIIGSHLPIDNPMDSSPDSAQHAVDAVEEVLDLMGKRGSVPVWLGAPHALKDSRTPIPSQASAAIIEEARRDVESRLFIACGGGLTDIASALLEAPDIADRLTVVWIGGDDGTEHQYPDFNVSIDPNAVRTVLCESQAEVWQIPLSTYATAILSMAELKKRIGQQGKLGQFLMERLHWMIDLHQSLGRPMGETYTMGDSPLVLVTALQSAFGRRALHLVERPVRQLGDNGQWGGDENPARVAKVVTQIDTRLLFEDFFARLEEHVSGDSEGNS